MTKPEEQLFYYGEGWREKLSEDPRFILTSQLYQEIVGHPIEKWLDGDQKISRWDIPPAKAEEIEKYKFRLFYMFPRPVIRAMRRENTPVNVFKIITHLAKYLGFSLSVSHRDVAHFKENEGKRTILYLQRVVGWDPARIAPVKYEKTGQKKRSDRCSPEPESRMKRPRKKVD